MTRHCAAPTPSAVALARAFDPRAPLAERLEARRAFVAQVRRVQRAAAAHAGIAGSRYEPRTEPQLSPIYTTYPRGPAVRAALGQSVVVEFMALVQAQVLAQSLGHWLADPGAADGVPTEHRDAYRAVVLAVVAAVDRRILYDDLARGRGLEVVEAYRVFLASQQTLRFESVVEAVDAAVLYGDLLPPRRWLEISGVAGALWRTADGTCAPFLRELRVANLNELVDVGLRWARSLAFALVPHLAQIDPRAVAHVSERPSPERPPHHPGAPKRVASPSAAAPTAAPSNLESRLRAAMGLGPSHVDSALADLAHRIAQHAASAVQQTSKSDDRRADLIEEALRAAPFGPGPMTGTPRTGHAVVTLVGDELAGGEVLDTALDASDDTRRGEQLAHAAAPLAERLRAVLRRREHVESALRAPTARGALSPGRLAVAQTSGAIYRQLAHQSSDDSTARSVVVVACDSSASLSAQQIGATKLLAAAWLRAARDTRVTVLCATYASARVSNADVPLVRWALHPFKTPSRSTADAVGAIASLPHIGIGTQSDALSLAWITDEADRVARGARIYLVVVSDASWNVSFGRERDGAEEVRKFFTSRRAALRGRLDVTLLVVGGTATGAISASVDRAASVPSRELRTIDAVTERVGVELARTIRQSGSRRVR